MKGRQRIRAWHLLVAVPVVCGVGGLSLSSYLEGRSRKAIDEEVAKLRALGAPMEAKDFVRNVPDGENAALLYQQGIEAYLRIGEVKPALSIAPALDNPNQPPSERAAIRRQIAALVPAISWIEKGAKRQQCEFPRRWEDGPALPFPELGHVRGVVKVLCARAELFAEQGDLQGALGQLELARTVGFHLRERTLISVLVSYACETLVLNEFTYLVARYGKPGNFARFRAFLASSPPPPNIREGLLGEPYFVRASIQMLRRQGIKALEQLTGTESTSPLDAVLLTNPHVLNALEGQMYRRLRELIATAQSTDDEGLRRALEAHDQAFESDQSIIGKLSQIFYPLWAGVGDLSLRNTAQRRIALATVWASEQRAATGKWPAALPDTFADPFSPKDPLRIRDEGSFARIYSVGRNRIDEAGRPVGPYKGNRPDDVELYVPKPR